MAMMISWVELVNPSHLYLENDQLRPLTPTICAFHLGFSLVVRNLCNDGSIGTEPLPGHTWLTETMAEQSGISPVISRMLVY